MADIVLFFLVIDFTQRGRLLRDCVDIGPDAQVRRYWIGQPNVVILPEYTVGLISRCALGGPAVQPLYSTLLGQACFTSDYLVCPGLSATQVPRRNCHNPE